MDANTAALVKERAEIRDRISQLYNGAYRSLLIHYACESFDAALGNPVRITGIAIRNLKTGQTVSWTIFGEAQRKKRTRTVLQDLDLLERSVLQAFSRHIKKYDDCTFIHWNMRDTKFGFTHLHRRATALGIKLHALQDSCKFDLSNAIYKLYGDRHAKPVATDGTTGRIFSIAELNGIDRREAISGKAEGEAFAQGEYVKIEGSTLRKLGIFSDIFDRLHRGNFKHEAPWRDTWGLSLSAGVHTLRTHWVVTLLIFLGAVGGASLKWWEVIKQLF